eukprot:TRINITY_DN19660_c1_g1_i1.p6 TRINITY_DN19660_c1_g1~~TRINITY_DN19660_c1_g1_i1.p6  ORF type:complete len:122 (+),score=4.01 TRINITY_DN19660_c1_g1_i1:778-1143(+)
MYGNVRQQIDFRNNYQFLSPRQIQQSEFLKFCLLLAQKKQIRQFYFSFIPVLKYQTRPIKDLIKVWFFVYFGPKKFVKFKECQKSIMNLRSLKFFYKKLVNLQALFCWQYWGFQIETTMDV